MKRIIILIIFGGVLIASQLVGCKIQIDVPVGGKVATDSHDYECLSGKTCIIDVDSVDFDQTFVGLPDKGYRFSGWRVQEKGLCGGRDRACRLSTARFARFRLLLSILKSDMVFYLTPVFTHQHTSRLSSGGYYRGGQASNCVIDRSGLRCWGALGQSAVPTDLSNPYHVDVDRHICALDDSGVRCWGNNEYGQTDVPDDLINPRFLSVGIEFTCVIDDTGVRCWGNNVYGQMNVPKLVNPRHISSDIYPCAIDDTGVVCWGTAIGSFDPDVLTELVNPRQVEVRGRDVCVIDDNDVHCWGDNISGPPFESENPRDVVIGSGFACILDDVGLRCWGDVPGEPLEGLVNPREMSAGSEHYCVLDDNGLNCRAVNNSFWGASNVPKSLINPREVSAGRDYTCAIEERGITCWGIGDPSTSTVITNPRQLAAGEYHHCVIGDTGVSCYGRRSGSIPATLTNPVEVSVGVLHSCAIDDYGVHCWGGHEWFPQDPPSDLINPHGLVSAGFENCVLDYGIVKCWGTDRSSAPKPSEQRYLNPRQLSLGWSGLCVLDDNGVQCLANQSKVPTDLVDPIMISSWGTDCVIDVDGVKCWGPNDFGQSNPPKDLVNPRQISVGFTHACALDDYGIRCWGSGEGNAAEAPDDLIF